MNGLSLGALVLLGGLFSAGFPSLGWTPHLPTWAERWLWNPRERTERSLAAAQKGDAKGAVPPADAALRLAPEDPIAAYDAGTAHLGAGDHRAAASLLSRAVDKARRDHRDELAAKASYNLGNTRLGAGDAAGAVEAYKQALRSEPDRADTKFNLELALRERDKERARQKAEAQKPGRKGDRGNGQGGSNSAGAERPGDKSREQDKEAKGEPKPGEGDPNRQGHDGQNDQQGRASPRSQGPLPQFRDQPDMSAAEAAALLQSVENLERQQRRAEAARRAQRRIAKGKDW